MARKGSSRGSSRSSQSSSSSSGSNRSRSSSNRGSSSSSRDRSSTGGSSSSSGTHADDFLRAESKDRAIGARTQETRVWSVSISVSISGSTSPIAHRPHCPPSPLITFQDWKNPAGRPTSLSFFRPANDRPTDRKKERKKERTRKGRQPERLELAGRAWVVCVVWVVCSGLVQAPRTSPSMSPSTSPSRRRRAHTRARALARARAYRQEHEGSMRLIVLRSS